MLRSPDDTDGFDYWWGYVVAADDPVLGKAPFLASKNLRFPDRERDCAPSSITWSTSSGASSSAPTRSAVSVGAARRAQLARGARPEAPRAHLERQSRQDEDLAVVRLPAHGDALLPHVRDRPPYPSIVQYLDAQGYLERAYQTARAYFTYPYEILPWYETYKWGCYNELVILDLIDALEREGLPDRRRGCAASGRRRSSTSSTTTSTRSAPSTRSTAPRSSRATRWPSTAPRTT